jgi:hypothetical protein
MSADDVDRVHAIRARAGQVKAELKAQHDAATDGFLREGRGIVPSHAQVREWEGKPSWSRSSGVFITNAPGPRDRKHRATNKPLGRPGNNDLGLAQAVYSLMANRGIGKAEAIAEIARWLVVIDKQNKEAHPTKKPLGFNAARDRVYLALRH